MMKTVSICFPTVPIVIRSGLSLFLGYTLLPHKVLRMCWDGWLLHRKTVTWLWLSDSFIKPSCIWFGRNETRELIQQWRSHQETLIAEIQQIVRLRLDPLARRQVIPPGQNYVLAAWFSFFDFWSMQFVAAKELGVVLVVGLVHPLFCKKFNLIKSTCSKKKKSYMANMFQKKKSYMTKKCGHTKILLQLRLSGDQQMQI